MRKTIIAVFLLATALLLPLLAIQSERSLLAIAHWSVKHFTDYRLELREPVVRLLKGEISAAQLHLYPKDDSGPPFVSVLGLLADVEARDIYAAGLNNTVLRAEQVIIFVSDTDTTSDPAPADWLSYTKWLPRRVKIDQVHLITASESTFIFPLQDLVATRNGDDQYEASAAAYYDGEPLALSLLLWGLKDQGKYKSLSGKATFTAPESNSSIVLDGELRGTQQAFTYNASLIGNYTDIGLFMRGFKGFDALQGSLGMTAKMQGSAEGFDLSEAHFSLDNMPAYSLEASGALRYTIGGDSAIELLASGDIESIGDVINWFDFDLSPLGRAKGSAAISGSLAEPILDELVLHTSKENGLQVSINGRFDPQETQQGTNQLSVKLAAPNLKAIQHWTGALPYELGPWSASAELRGTREQIAVNDLVVEIGSVQTALMRIDGSVGNIANLQKGGLSGLENAQLKLSGSVADSAKLGELLQAELPGGFQINGDVQLSGAGDQLQITAGEIALSSADINALITPTTGSVQLAADAIVQELRASVALSISDASALSQYANLTIPKLGPVTASAVVAQNGDNFALHDIGLRIEGESLQLESTGNIADVAALSGVTFDTHFSQIPIRPWVNRAVNDFAYEPALGLISGSFQLKRSTNKWDIHRLAVTTHPNNNSLALFASGSILDVAGELAADLTASFAIHDSDLLQSLFGWPVAPLKGTVTLTSSSATIDVNGQARAGETIVNVISAITHEQQKITDLKLNIHSPHVYLDDLGLQAQTNSETDSAYKPADQLSEIEKTKALEYAMQHSPKFATDVTVAFDGISGDATSIERFSAHLTGLDNRYTLRDFSFDYAQAKAEILGMIDINTTPPFISLAGEARALPLNHLSRDLGFDTGIAGALTMRGGITASGTRGDVLLKNLNGGIALALENAVIKGAAYDMLATDFLAWIYSGAALEESTYIDCTMANFQLGSGIANTDSLFIESARMTATGEAKLDLPAQKLDIKVTPRSKSRTLQVPSAIRLKGSFSDPRATVSPITTAVDTSAQLLTLIPTILMKVFGIEKDTKQHRPCIAAG